MDVRAIAKGQGLEFIAPGYPPVRLLLLHIRGETGYVGIWTTAEIQIEAIFNQSPLAEIEKAKAAHSG